MRIDQLIASLKTLAAQHGQDLPVYTYGDSNEEEVSGIKFRESETVENYDDPDGPELPLYPNRIYLKP